MEVDLEFKNLFSAQADPTGAPRQNSGCFGTDDDIREAPPITYTQNDDVDTFVQKVFGIAPQREEAPLAKSKDGLAIARIEVVEQDGAYFSKAFNAAGDVVGFRRIYDLPAGPSCDDFFGGTVAKTDAPEVPLAKSEITSRMHKSLQQLRDVMSGTEIALAEKAVRALDVTAFLEITEGVIRRVKAA